ncbi:MAG: hypothetical protein QM831_41410 [Kofleriaceae bacterium]
MSEVAYWLGQLASADPRHRIEALKQIAAAPEADHELLAATERLLDDREVCLVQIPYRFGEVRFFAPDAVVAVRQLLGNHEPVVLADTFYPLDTSDVLRLAGASQLQTTGGVDGVVAALRELVLRDRVRRRRIERP